MAKERVKFAVIQRSALRPMLWVLALLALASNWIPFLKDIQISGTLTLVALIAIITLLDPVEEINQGVKFLQTRTPSRSIPSVNQMYSELNRAVDSATSSLDLTHIRDQRPEAFGEEAEKYNARITVWLKEAPGRSVRRIISANHPDMQAWAKDLLTEVKVTPGYHVKVVDWSINAPAPNLAIIDQRLVFLALSGDLPERTKGFVVEDPTTAEYFTDYYAGLWNAANDLEEYVKKNQSG